ncbi:hypothetical protein F2Q70_00021538 [Brassica cretica]|uniref:Uncharacterized protein n=1 Tax=Brassica cretica TaxID=69181 RepID=A0A8S9GSB6_BRACR|nr:hypothetical protein F2Q70_00021538 [Brassica cretica]
MVDGALRRFRLGCNWMLARPAEKFSSEVFHFPEEGCDPGTGPEKHHSGEPGFLLAGILGTGVPSSRDPGNRGSFQQGSRGRCPAWDRGLVLLGLMILVEDGKLWASDDVLDTMEPGALMFPKEELHALICRG